MTKGNPSVVDVEETRQEKEFQTGVATTGDWAEDTAEVGRKVSPHFSFISIWVLVAASLTLSLMVGRYPNLYFTLPIDLINDDLALQLVWNLRFPRILLAFLTGMALAASGAVLQMVFRNPLVEPGFLGVSQGATFGAAFAIIFLGSNPFFVQGLAATFAIAALGTSYFVARQIRYGDWVLRFVLAGIAVSAIFSSGVGVLKYLADPLRQLPEITFWLLGGLWSTTWPDLLHVLPVVVPCMFVLYLMRWRLNLLSLRDETAFSLGTMPGRERGVLLLAAVASTAVVVSKAGIVGWVGLIVPHISRRLLGTDAQKSLPGSMLIGGVFVLLCDDIGRTVLAGEIPLGIITSLFGAIFFLVLMSSGTELKRGPNR